MKEIVVRCVLKLESESKVIHTEHRIEYQEYSLQLDTSEYNVTSITCPVCCRQITFMVLPRLPFLDGISVGLTAVKRSTVAIALYIPILWPIFFFDALKPLKLKVAITESEAYKHAVFYRGANIGLSGGYNSEFTDARIEYYQQRIQKREEPLQKKAKGTGISTTALRTSLDTLKAKRDFEALSNAHAVDQLLKLLQSDDHNIRKRAVKALGEAGDIAVVPHLVRAALLDVHVRDTVLAAVEHFQWKPTEDSIGGAFMLLKLPKEDRPRRNELGNMVMRAGLLSVVPLIATLSDKEIPSAWRILAGDVLSTIGDTRAIVPLVEVLRERDLAGESRSGKSLRLATLLHLIRFRNEAKEPVKDLLALAIRENNEELQSDCLTILSNVAKTNNDGSA